MRIAFQVLLAALIIFLGYMVFQSINRPLEYKKIKTKRDKQVIAKLKDIRAAQNAYKLAKGKFTSSFDTLENFVETGYVPLIKRTGVLTDDMLADGIDEKKAIAKGLIQVDTIRVSVMDSIFKNRTDFKVENMRYLPIPGNKTFEMAASELETESGVPVPVYEAKTHFDILLEDLRNGEYNEEYRSDTMEMNRLKKFVGWKIGSLVEANDGVGNWE